MKIAILSIALFACFQLCAQAPHAANIKWHSISTLNTTTGDEIVEDVVLTTHRSQQVALIQGGVERGFDVTGVVGSWSDVGADGEITYKIKSESGRGTITLSRTGGMYKVRMILVGDAEEISSHEFTVSKIEIIP
jgi:hypothetical protein